MNHFRSLILLLCLIYPSINSPIWASQQEEQKNSATGLPAPAGQMCNRGSYVIGFDTKGNIICNDSKKVATKVADAEITAKPILVKPVPAAPVIVPSVAELSISDIQPSSVVFGTREVTISVTGTGFHEQSVIIFEGSTYDTSVNQAGTQLDATLTIGSLTIGPYTVTVSNGSGKVAKLKKALEVY